ncbi:MAG: YceI family protein [Pseudomonadota bacterium]
MALTRRIYQFLGIAAPVFLAAAPASSEPVEWRIDQVGSEIRFDYQLWGDPRTGTFRRFGGRARLDPDDPAKANLVLRIASRSVDLGSRLYSSLATSSEWFNAKQHPQVVYRLQSLAPMENGGYWSIGTVTIRGVTRRVETEMTLLTTANHFTASGTLTLDRRPFGLGVGIGEIFVDVADEVAVSFVVLARREGG